MASLDTAVASSNAPNSPATTAHFSASLGRAATILETSLTLSQGDQFAGPAQAQLLITAEIDGGTADVACAAAIEAMCRELLRDDAWLIALRKNQQDLPSSSLAAAVRAAMGSVAAQSHADRDPTQEVAVISLCVGLVAWPYAVVAQAGEAVVAVVESNSVSFPFLSIPSPTARDKERVDSGSTETSTAPVIGGKEVSGEVVGRAIMLSDTDILLLGTRELRLPDLTKTSQRLGEIDRQASASRIVEQLQETTPEGSSSAVGVAKLTHELLDALSEVEAVRDSTENAPHKAGGEVTQDQGKGSLVSVAPGRSRADID